MPWHDDYRAKLCTPDQAVADLQPGMSVYMGGNAATPRTLAGALAARAEQVEGLQVAHVLLLGDDPFAHAKKQGLIRHLSYFVGPGDRAAVNAGTAAYVLCGASSAGLQFSVTCGEEPGATATRSSTLHTISQW